MEGREPSYATISTLRTTILQKPLQPHGPQKNSSIAISLKAFVKTSGKTGIHLFVPCNGFNFMQARTIAENICSGIHELVPSITTTNVSVSSRGNKLYLDPNQNDYADTVASAYSARPHGKPTVSAPLEWKEVKDGLSMDAFTILNIEKRLGKKGDLFEGVFDKKLAMKNAKVLKGFL